MVEVAREAIVGGGVLFVLALVFAHLRGRDSGRREQEEIFNADEREGLHLRIDDLKGAVGTAQRDKAALHETLIAERRDFKDVLQSAEGKYQRMLDEDTAELADAARRLDFFWAYPCKVSLSAENGPQVRFRAEPQEKGEFYDALTKILAAEGEEAASDA